jgi:Protein of unknown function (DUF2939)
MRRPIITLLGLLLLATGYIVYPFATAWNIREAIHTGNAGYLEKKIEWNSIRDSLRRSLTRIALPETAADSLERTSAQPGLWTRIKTRIGQQAVDRMVANYVTPTGLTQLFEYRQIYRRHMASDEKPALIERISRFWKRVKRAEFKTPTAFEVEVADKHNKSRHYVGLLQLRGFEWKLTNLEVRLVNTNTRRVGQTL